jgi:hypothetical protein
VDVLVVLVIACHDAATYYSRASVSHVGIGAFNQRRDYMAGIRPGSTFLPT